MKLQEVIDAWNERADKNNQWSALGTDEAVEFAMKHIAKEANSALDELLVSVYKPDVAAMSVAHAVGHVKQVFYDFTEKQQ